MPIAVDPATLLDGLNPQQRKAVVHQGGPLLIVAGAGSGKTRVLTNRVAYLLAERGARPGEILAITFTNKAAGEMKERVAALVGPRARSMWVSTFHSMCVRILRADGSSLGLKSSFSIYDADDSTRLMTLVSRELDLDSKRYPPRSLCGQVSNLKNELVTPAAWADKASNAHEKVLAEAYTRYQSRLREAHALSRRLKEDLQVKFPELSDVVIHVEPAARAAERRFRAYSRPTSWPSLFDLVVQFAISLKDWSDRRIADALLLALDHYACVTKYCDFWLAVIHCCHLPSF